MDIIGPIEPVASNGCRFILVAIYYFIKWVEAASYKAVTKKVVEDFVLDRIGCWFGVSESIIIDNAANLNNDPMKAMCETFKIKHKNSMAYRPQMDGAVEAANKNIKKILRKMAKAIHTGAIGAKANLLTSNEAKGKFSPNWQGPYMVHRVLTGRALTLAEIDGEIWPKPINSDVVKRYYV
ncbi:uncharacterized protein [Nicotiana sylvestris]|uniref:uncharacterized protein n=1 Tax=Nicotiana sylvestris TaxID=4096 RepID=UPI00388CB70B